MPKKSKTGNTTIVIDDDGKPTVQQPIPVVLKRAGGESSNSFIQGKNSKKLKTRSMDAFVVKDLGMHENAKDGVEKWAKEFAMDVVLTGCKKMVSEKIVVRILRYCHKRCKYLP